LELVDKRDLKSLGQKPCGFDSRSAHQRKCRGLSSVFSLVDDEVVGIEPVAVRA